MKHDIALIATAAGVWALLALVYALTPGLAMPGYVRVWGTGALLLLGLAGLLIQSRRKR